MDALGKVRLSLHVNPPSDPAAIGREVVRAMRQRRSLDAQQDPLNAHGNWERQWEDLTGVSWSEWVRRHRSKRVRILLAERDEDVRVWIDDHEVHGVIRSVAVTRFVRHQGEVTLTIPLGLVELL